MTNEEYKQKRDELISLSRSIDLYKSTKQAKKHKARIDPLLDKLQADTFALECTLIEVKLRIFREILVILKSDV
jgi:hypothetical protein